MSSFEATSPVLVRSLTLVSWLSLRIFCSKWLWTAC